MNICDTGAFIATERNDRAMWRRLKATLASGQLPVSSAAVVGQVWRGDPRHASLARSLSSVEIEPLTEASGRAAGVLLAHAGTSDVIDAAVVLLAVDGDTIYTSDPDDIAHLAATAGLHVEVVPV